MNVENIVTGETTTRQLRAILFNYNGYRCDEVRRRLFYSDNQDLQATASDVNDAKQAITLDLCNACGND